MYFKSNITVLQNVTATKHIVPGGLTTQVLMANGDIKALGTIAGTIAHGDHAHNFASLTSTPTTITGYGITDAYTTWNLKTNGVQRTGMASGSSLDIVAGTNMSVSYSAGGVVTLSSTDTNTDTNFYLTGLSYAAATSVLTATVTGASNVTVDLSNSIYADALAVTGNGTTAQYLRSDGDGTFTWATPTDTNTWIANSQVNAGYVAAGGANYNKVWATDGAGNPGWGSVPETAGATATHTQGTAATTWTFNHNLGQLYPTITVYNASNQVVIPQTITAVSINQLTIVFSSALTGTAVAVLGGTGAQGLPGDTPTLGVGTVTTGAAGSSVIITAGGTALARTFNFTIPRGDAGAAGIQLTNLSSTMTGLTYTNTTGVFSATAGYSIPTTTNQTNWSTAYTQTLQWNGGATGLVAATGRTSLGLVIGTNVQAYNANTTVQGVITLASLGYVAYSHPTGDGNLHVPATSTTNNGKVLTAGATAGVFSWQTPASGVTDHTLLSNIGTNTHAQIDTHIADATKHFTQAAISITASQVSDFDTEVANNTTVTGKVTGNTAITGATKTKITYDSKGLVTAGADMTTVDVIIDDHSSTPSTAKIVGIVYGTSETPPTANTTPIGTLYIQYTA